MAKKTPATDPAAPFNDKPETATDFIRRAVIENPEISLDALKKAVAAAGLDVKDSTVQQRRAIERANLKRAKDQPAPASLAVR